MPYSVNGIGTGLVKASKVRTVNGYVQFDAVEAFIIFSIPIVPYKSIHVLHYEAGKYQSVKLNPSARLIAKAMLNGWGNGLMIFGGATALAAGYAFYTMTRPFNFQDMMFLAILVGLLIVGILCKGMWYLLNDTDERIKDLIGPHQLGTADPLYWPNEMAVTGAKKILEHEASQSLLDAANRAFVEGNRSKAMICLRLAMRDGKTPQTNTLFDQMLASKA